MGTASRAASSLTSLGCAFSLIVAAPTAVRAQAESSAPAASESAAVKDLPLVAAERLGFVGRYALAIPGSGQPPRVLRIFDEQGALMGQVNGNDAMRMLYQGNNVFRAEADPAVITFTVEGRRATRVAVTLPEGAMEGTRIEDESSGGDRKATAVRPSGAP